MASSFRDLLKIAKAHSDDTKREALEASKRREAALRQAREEQDRKERAEKELQKRLALKRAEETKKEQERKRLREEEVARRREELVKKKEESREETRNGRSGRSDSSMPRSKYITTSSTALTREEKRMARDPLYKDELGKGKAKAAALQKLKNGRLPGGALPIVENGIGGPSKNGLNAKSGSSSAMTGRARLSANFPPTLMRLNTEKRDLRSIDEIAQDLRKGKPDGPPAVEQKSTISGPQASSYNDWFGKKKDKAPEQVNGSATSRKDLKHSSLNTGIGNMSLNKPKASNTSQIPSSSKSATAKKSAAATGSGATSRKRSRSSDLDDSDSYDSDDRYYREKRSKRSTNIEGDDLQGDMRELIWGLMGKSRQKYTSMNVESDDDMEATGAELEREEMQSARIAKKEDAEAEAEEKRRELEKKRRKTEKSR